jgi:hypothetical protein
VGLALVELKFAPDPTASAAATIRAPNAKSTFRGEVFHNVFILFMAISFAVIAFGQPTG